MTITFKIHYMLISKDIFVIFLSLFVIKSFRGMGVGEEGKAPSILKFDVFPSNFSQKKLFSQFRVVKMKFCHFYPPCKNIFGQPLDISVGASKFLGVRRIFARSPPNLPEKFCVTFANKFPPIKNPFWCDLQKRIHVFFCKRWAPFF